MFAHLEKEKREREAQERAAARERGEKPARPRNKFDEKSEYENRLDLKEAALTACVAQHSAPTQANCLAEGTVSKLPRSPQPRNSIVLLCFCRLVILLGLLLEIPVQYR